MSPPQVRPRKIRAKGEPQLHCSHHPATVRDHVGPFRQLCALLLCLLLLPGWGELMENVEHLVHDGHPAHLVSHDDDGEDEARHEALAAEHGCTPLSHTCPCHTSIPAVLPVGFELPAAIRIEILRDRPLGLEQHVRHRANAPPVPPPRA